MKPSEIKFRMYRHTDQVTKGDHFYFQVKYSKTMDWGHITGFTDGTFWATRSDVNGHSPYLHRLELTSRELHSARGLIAEDCDSLLVARLIVASRQAAAVLARDGDDDE